MLFLLLDVYLYREGYIAIVHDAMSTYIDSIPWLVEEENTLNWFRVFWDGDDYPGSSETNTCEMNKCKTTTDGSCVCKTLVTDNVVFTNMSITKEDVMSQLFIGSVGPQVDSVATSIADGLIIHTIDGVVDDKTVFEVQDKGRTMYLKNIVSMVSVEGWDLMTPKIYEAENAATLHNTVSCSMFVYILNLLPFIAYPLAIIFHLCLFTLVCVAKLGWSEEQHQQRISGILR